MTEIECRLRPAFRSSQKKTNKTTKPMILTKTLSVAAVAATLLFQTSTAQADDHGQQSNHKNGDATVNFTKWIITPFPPADDIFANMAGVIVGGDVGDGTFTGEALTLVVDPATGVMTVEAVYHLHGSKHSFTARIHAEQEVAGVGQKGVITGVVTDGWLKGHAVEGEWTVIDPCYETGGVGNCFEVTLDLIKRHSNE
jgi:hypothetical protein